MAKPVGRKSSTIIGDYMRYLMILLSALLLNNCSSTPVEEPVQAGQYDSFWLWAGVEPQPALAGAKTIYILEAEILDGPTTSFNRRRASTPRIQHADIWIVYRVETLQWGPEILPRMIADLARWRAAGNRVQGVQIDFDAATQGLPDYARFLGNLRAQLPKNNKLSVTGLLDWSSGQGEKGPALNALSGVVDEVVLQTYQGRSTVFDYQRYLPQLEGLRLPFRLGLVQNGAWLAPDDLARNRYFKGYVVFLLNPDTVKPR